MIVKSQFEPATGLSNPHIQTILPGLLRSGMSVDYVEQTIETNDGDFIDLAWSRPPTDGQPLVLILHGLQGSAQSSYVKGLIQKIRNNHWNGVVMHFRSCSGRINRLARNYHSGDTSDLSLVVEYLRRTFPASPLMAVGYSLGGNVLLKYLGESGQDSPFLASVSVSAPLDLSGCAGKLQSGTSRIYQAYLIRQLKSTMRHKMRLHDYEQLIQLSAARFEEIRTFWQFDNRITAPLHGFENVHDYYGKCSSRQFLAQIRSPVLLIQARDDPFLPTDMLPDLSELSSSTQMEVSHYGGHVGFIGGGLLQPVFWLEHRIVEYFAGIINTMAKSGQGK